MFMTQKWIHTTHIDKYISIDEILGANKKASELRDGQMDTCVAVGLIAFSSEHYFLFEFNHIFPS